MNVTNNSFSNDAALLVGIGCIGAGAVRWLSQSETVSVAIDRTVLAAQCLCFDFNIPLLITGATALANAGDPKCLADWNMGKMCLATIAGLQVLRALEYPELPDFFYRQNESDTRRFLQSAVTAVAGIAVLTLIGNMAAKN